MKKKGFTLIELLAVIIILAIIALIATPIILNVIDDARKSAGLSESEMIMSGINNYCATSKVKNQLDGSEDICADGVTTEEVSKMVNLGNAKVIKVTYSNDKVTELVIESNNNEYTLQPNGSFSINGEPTNPEEPEEESLISTLLSQYSEGATTGLVKDASNPNLYYYKGTNDEVTNNYLWYGGHHWRVVEFNTSDNTLLLISTQPLTAIQPASAVWDTEEEYENSYINKWLNEVFYNSLESSIQNNIINNTFNVGIYTDVDEITTVKKVGLLDNDQYNRAGEANSYLNIKDHFWLANRYNESYTSNIQDNGKLIYIDLSGARGVRAVMKISDIKITGGSGTLESNYETASNSTSTSNIQVGEYINVPYNGSDNACGSDNKCTFRVVSKDSDSIKVVLNGLLPNFSQFGDTATITLDHTIYTPLNAFANNISTNYRYTENKTFYIGDYSQVSGTGQNYEDIQDETLEANVGLVTVAEIFSGNDIDLGTTNDKVFVNINTIENPLAREYYWIINRYNSSEIRYVHYNCYLYHNVSTAISAIRPVIFLKNNLNFVSGKGTAESPYELQ